MTYSPTLFNFLLELNSRIELFFRYYLNLHELGLLYA